MIKTIREDVFIDGVTMNVKSGYKRSDSIVLPGEFYVLDDDKRPHKPLVLGIYDTLSAYILTKVNLVSGNTYSLSGTCAPVGSTVFVTPSNALNSVKEMVDNCITSTVSDDAGEFSISYIDGNVGEIAIWISTPIEFIQAAYVSCTPTVTNSLETDGRVTQQTIVLTPYKQSEIEEW